MLIISLEVMKIIDERETQKKKKDREEQGDKSYSERVRARWFCCVIKLGFFESICKASLIFKSNLELPLSIILKDQELYELKHVAVECLKIWDLLSFLIFSSILVLKWRHVLPI